MERLKTSNVSITVARTSFIGKFTAKIDFPIGCFMLPLLMLALEVYTLFDKYLGHMLAKFEQTHMVQTIQNFKLFDKVLTPFWKTFL